MNHTTNMSAFNLSRQIKRCSEQELIALLDAYKRNGLQDSVEYRLTLNEYDNRLMI